MFIRVVHNDHCGLLAVCGFGAPSMHTAQGMLYCTCAMNFIATTIVLMLVVTHNMVKVYPSVLYMRTWVKGFHKCGPLLSPGD